MDRAMGLSIIVEPEGELAGAFEPAQARGKSSAMAVDKPYWPWYIDICQ
jgi:hypothetical protein